MKKVFYLFGILIPIAALVGAASFSFLHLASARAASSCTPTGFFRDNIDLTAAVIDPPGTYTATLNAAPCNIGVYYSPGAKGTIANSEIYGANYFGVVNNGGHVTVKRSFVHDIGEVPFNGTQHGVGIYFAFDSGATGSISDNRVTRYQKGGIVVTGSSDSAQINHNTVLGLGPVDFIAQNGIEVGAGAKATVTNNTVTGNSYTGTNYASSTGILTFGGSCYGTPLTTKTRIVGNTVTGNDIGIIPSNLDIDPHNPNNCIWALTPTNDYIAHNISSNDSVNNISGEGTTPIAGYQAGIDDQGNGDKIIDNDVCGVGYTPLITPPPFLVMIDITFAVNVTVKDNTTCGVKSTNMTQAATTQHARGHVKANVLH